MANAAKALLETMIVLTLVFGAFILAADLLYGAPADGAAAISVAAR